MRGKITNAHRAVLDEFTRRSNIDNAEDYFAIHGRYPEGFDEARDAQLQAAAEKIIADEAGGPAPRFYARDDRYVFDSDTGDGLNSVDRAIARTAPTTPVYFEDDGTVSGGEVITDRLGYVNIEDAFGEPQTNASHLGIDPENNAVHKALVFPDSVVPTSIEEKQAVQIAKAMAADDADSYRSAIIERDVPEDYAVDYVGRFKTAGGKKVLDYLAQAGNSGRDVYLMGGDKRISELQNPKYKDEKAALLNDRKGALSKLLVDTGFRSANNPNRGMRIPGQDLEMDHAKDYRSSADATGDFSSFMADDRANQTFLGREANGQTKNDRPLSATYNLMQTGAILKMAGINPLDAKKLEGRDLVNDLIDRSSQVDQHGRVLTPGQVKRGEAEEAQQFATLLGNSLAGKQVTLKPIMRQGTVEKSFDPMVKDIREDDTIQYDKTRMAGDVFEQSEEGPGDMRGKAIHISTGGGDVHLGSAKVNGNGKH